MKQGEVRHRAVHALRLMRLRLWVTINVHIDRLFNNFVGLAPVVQRLASI